jgi:hypothetical protein
MRGDTGGDTEEARQETRRLQARTRALQLVALLGRRLVVALLAVVLGDARLVTLNTELNAADGIGLSERPKSSCFVLLTASRTRRRSP